MDSILIYTYRTFPYCEQLKNIADEVFVLGKLKRDFVELENLILNGNYDYIVGIARGTTESVFETKGVNQFNKGKILKEGKNSYILEYPTQGFQTIGVNNSYTKSFCNWGIYNVAKIINDNHLSVRHSFVHILEEDIPILKQYLESK